MLEVFNEGKKAESFGKSQRLPVDKEDKKMIEILETYMIRAASIDREGSNKLLNKEKV
ncbi:hypothetical protein [Methanosarcina horonobensis]|uniref:hypothetical protein n=1 Tax=Methanosarcina horonobensis TaxID=418008 RepID=UPI000AE58E7D|nr:hypothetical protein [Methanosarcina horonobensis]